MSTPGGADPARQALAAPPLEHRTHIEAATRRYLATLEHLDDTGLRAPSLLPGWTRAHVVTHVARNADALAGVLAGARTGRERPMYPSREQRDADIEAGAGRPAAQLRADARESAERFADTMATTPGEAWERDTPRVPGGPRFPVADVPWMRWSEVEVHHVDLGVDLGVAPSPTDWETAFCELLVERVRLDRSAGPAMLLHATDCRRRWSCGDTGTAPEEAEVPEVSGPVAELAWWLLGRGDGSGLTSSTGELPRLGPWR